MTDQFKSVWLISAFFNKQLIGRLISLEQVQNTDLDFELPGCQVIKSVDTVIQLIVEWLFVCPNPIYCIRNPCSSDCRSSSRFIQISDHNRPSQHCGRVNALKITNMITVSGSTIINIFIWWNSILITSDLTVGTF